MLVADRRLAWCVEVHLRPHRRRVTDAFATPLCVVRFESPEERDRTAPTFSCAPPILPLPLRSGLTRGRLAAYMPPKHETCAVAEFAWLVAVVNSRLTKQFALCDRPLVTG